MCVDMRYVMSLLFCSYFDYNTFLQYSNLLSNLHKFKNIT